MTKDEVLQAVEEIKKSASRQDDAAAHIREDNLRENFIQFIASRNDELGEIARIILSTKDIDFGRWFE